MAFPFLIFLAAAVQASRLPGVPEGFEIRRAAGKEVVYPMFAAFDDRGRLFVTESSGNDLYVELQNLTRKCRVRLLEDRDGDGFFETSSIFAEGLTPSMGLVWRDGRLWVADPPDLVTLEDTDGDGRADRRTVVLTGFGHRDNGSLHGLTFGPDGRLHFTMGQPDGYKLKRPDGSFLEGYSGALLRSRPDGSHPEVVTRGFENLIEVVWTDRGEAIGTVNWFQKPRDGLRDAIVHQSEGGLYPYKPDQATPLPITGELLPAVARFPAVALSGLDRYRGASFPAEMRGNLFAAQHNTGKVSRHVLRRVGSTFETLDSDFVTPHHPDFRPSDVLEDADGSLIVVDTGAWYVQHCPRAKIRITRPSGGIYRVRAAGARRVDDPWGLKIPWTRASGPQLAGLLADPRPAVRDRAREHLISRNESDVLASILAGPAEAGVKQRAAWALAAMKTPSASAVLRRAVPGTAPDVAAALARSLGYRRDKEAAPVLADHLSSEDLTVQFAAAEALAWCGNGDSVEPILEALAGKPDTFVEHALVHALYRHASREDLIGALADPHPRVQKAALLLLDQPPRDGAPRAAVIERVSAADGALRKTALSILQKHPDWSKEAVALIRRWLKRDSLNEEERSGLGSSILAFQSDPGIQLAVAGAMGEDAPPDRTLLLLRTIARSTLPRLPGPWRGAVGRLLRNGGAESRLEAARIVTAFRVDGLDDALEALAADDDVAKPTRVEALRARVPRHPVLESPAFDLLVGRLEGADDPVARLAAAEVLRRAHLTDIQTAAVVRAAQGNALIRPGVLLAAFRTSTGAASTGAMLDVIADAVKTGWKPAPAEFQAFAERLPDAFRAKAKELAASLTVGDADRRAKLVAFEPLLEGGDRERGRAVFFGKKVACFGCHRVAGEGGRIGPDLTKIGAIRGGGDLLESLLIPSSTFAQGYESYLVATKDGEILTGLIARRTADAIVLRDSSGGEVQVRADRIDRMKRAALSIMPEGLERNLTRDELRDLLAYLQSLK